MSICKFTVSCIIAGIAVVDWQLKQGFGKVAAVTAMRGGWGGCPHNVMAVLTINIIVISIHNINIHCNIPIHAI